MAFSIEIDARKLSSLLFQVPVVTSDWIETQTLQKWDMSEGLYTLTYSSGQSLEFIVTSAGLVDYDPVYDQYVVGRGTSRLELVGYTVTVDATRPSHPHFFISGVTSQWTDAQVPHAFQLLPGSYYFHHASGQATTFLVTAQGAIDYDPALDVPAGSTQGVFRGRGSTTLELVGYAITINATRPSHPLFFISGVTSQWMDAQVSHAFRLLPGSYYFHHASGQVTTFLVTMQGTIDYEPDLDVPPGNTQGVFRGRGSTTLELVGYAITVDATRPSHPQFFIPGVTSEWTDAQVPHAFQLLPGSYYLYHANEQATVFLVTAQGAIDYDPVVDVPAGSTQGVFRGRGSTTLELVGYAITVDATRSSHPEFFIPRVTSQWTDAKVPHAFQLLPGSYYLYHAPGQATVFLVTAQGAIDYDPALDVPPGSTQGVFRGRGSATLELVGPAVSMDTTTVPMDTTRFWLRLEPNSIDENLGAGLQAAIHDPLWMLARQWQTGEYQGDDAGSPVHVQLTMSCTPLTRYSSSGVAMGPLPLETLVEREEVRVSEKFQPRLAAEAGLQFLRLLEAQSDSGTLRNGVLQIFPLRVPDEELLKKLDHNTISFLRVMANRVPDGHLLYAAFKTNSEIWQKWLQSFNKSELKTLEETIDAWRKWYETLFSEPATNESAWLPNRLEYSIAVAAPIPGGEVVLSAPEYIGGHLDWYSFNIQPAATLKAERADLNKEALEAENKSHSAIPMPINYRGMPVSRYWEFEDARVDFGAMTAGQQQLAKLILIDFALIAGDDWFIIPVMVPVGTLCNTSLLEVQDTFGKVWDISSAYSKDIKEIEEKGLQEKDLPWNLFRLSLDQRSTDQQAQSVPPFNLFLPPTLDTSLNGPALEEVLFLRDEMANMAWAVERMVEGPLGQAFNRSEAYFRSRESKTPPSGSTGSAGENTQHLVYRLESEVPDHWISLQPVRIGSAAIGFEPHGDWQGRILRSNKDNQPMLIHEEEVPREGAYVTRAFQYARWIDGETYLWIGRRKGVGRGEGSSGLQFDRLDPPAKKNT